jgi:Arm DNA-binding domain
MAINKLTNAALRAAKPTEKPYKLTDGGGLYLLINPSGALWWRLKYRFEGREKLLSLGVHPHVSLQRARAARRSEESHCQRSRSERQTPGREIRHGEFL